MQIKSNNKYIKECIDKYVQVSKKKGCKLLKVKNFKIRN